MTEAAIESQTQYLTFHFPTLAQQPCNLNMIANDNVWFPTTNAALPHSTNMGNPLTRQDIYKLKKQDKRKKLHFSLRFFRFSQNHPGFLDGLRTHFHNNKPCSKRCQRNSKNEIPIENFFAKKLD